ncbi:MAG: hypothetical protein ACP5IB_08745 [Thermoplasmata archaeon]
MDKQTFKLSDGSLYNFYKERVEVVSEPKIWTEQRVHSEGGYGFIWSTNTLRTYGKINIAPTETTVTERISFFVKKENGTETELRDTVNARMGHILHIIYSGDNGKQPTMSAVYNTNSGEYYLDRNRYRTKYLEFLSILKSMLIGRNMYLFYPLLFLLILGLSWYNVHYNSIHFSLLLDIVLIVIGISIIYNIISNIIYKSIVFLVMIALYYYNSHHYLVHNFVIFFGIVGFLVMYKIIYSIEYNKRFNELDQLLLKFIKS